ncbi:glutathione S-transferase kappa 1 [Varanus komodoensis]|uniref:Glutathione S-transferase kappa n=1 Tax=Varanus komodoensis TaxID=61221 RepID=A0A8D2IYY0_VARKO|nr:glutathione S-transferase kappa 1 [Varanus komodoensis]
MYRSRLLGSAVRARSMATAREGLGSEKKVVHCFYDVVSPYSWLGFEIICRYRPIWNMDLRFRPVFLAGIMKETGNRAPALLREKAVYMTQDLQRLGKFCQVPLRPPKDFMGTVIEKGSLPAMRFLTAVDILQPEFVEPVSKEFWMRIWSRDEDITQPESILAVAGKAGLPSDKAQKLLEMSTSPEVKNHLKETTSEVLRYGAFGVPCFVVHVDSKPQLLFGSDRLELLGSLLGEKWLGPVPTSSKL